MSQKTAFIFTGQGSQFCGMGRDFYENSALAREMFDKTSDRLGLDMKALMFEENENLNETEFAQAAILLCSAIALKLFQEQCDIAPSFVLGHSLGEISAALSVGALDVYDGAELVRERGLLMKKACEGKNAGMMVVLGLDDEKAQNICLEAQQKGAQIWAANYNCDGQIVIAGTKSDLEKYADTFKAAGAKRAMLLAMSVASHCPILAGAQEGLREKLNLFIKDSFSAPVISNVNALPYQNRAKAVELLTEQLVKPVLYKQSIEKNSADIFIEFGGKVLSGLNKKLTSAPTCSITDMASLDETLKALKG